MKKADLLININNLQKLRADSLAARTGSLRSYARLLESEVEELHLFAERVGMAFAVKDIGDVDD